jgi:hypothetical protein
MKKITEYSEFEEALNKAEQILNFEGVVFQGIDFSNKKLKNIFFKNAKFTNCNFRKATIEACDFRYATITDSTFEGAKLDYVDFYRAAFKGICVFQDCEIRLSSFNYTSFETFCFTRTDLKETKSSSGEKCYIVQEDKSAMADFWGKFPRIDSVGKDATDKQQESLNNHYREAEMIYRQLSAMWASKGFNRDAEWAYVQAKRMERKYLWQNKCTGNNSLKAIANGFIDFFFGYGVRLRNVVILYLALIVMFGLFYVFLDNSPGSSLLFSFSKATGAEHGINDLLSFLKDSWGIFFAGLQTGIGMFLTGFIGFVVANKISKS